MGVIVRMTSSGPAVWCPGCASPHVFNSAATPTRKGASWSFNGSALQPTFSPSMHVHVGTGVKPGGDPRNLDDWLYRTVCHSFVTDGRIQFLADSAHALKGTTVPLPEWPLSALATDL